MAFQQHFMLLHQQPVQLGCCLSDSTKNPRPDNHHEIQKRIKE
jgi:hypothetical protein